MPKIEAETATGPQAFDAPKGKKLVLAIEDSGIDILHRCGGNAKCTTCHSGGSPPQGLNLSSATSFGLLVNVNSNELPSMKRIKPNDVPNSYLVHKVEGTQGSVGGSGSKMPLGCSGSTCLTSTQINDIKAWINAGAPPP